MKTILRKSGDGTTSSPASTTKTFTKRLSAAPQPEPQPEETAAEPEMLSPDLSADEEVAQAYVADYQSAAQVPRAQIYEERARKLGDHYGVEIEPTGWHATEGEVYRIEKPIRVRVHKDCHRCQTSFGNSSQCPNCNHHYCSKCGRDPPKRTDSQKQASREKREKAETSAMMRKQEQFAPIIPHYGLAEPIVVTRPSRTGGQPLVHKVPRMRLRRSCHRCNTTFTQSTRVCENCGHRRCDDCPKTPHKKKKYPYGYPGDEDGTSSSAFYECHECHENFPAHADDGVRCANCSHEKCPECRRMPRRVVNLEPNPDILRGISSRFEHLELTEPISI
ncbi:hypothetical protein PFICI_04251 [Pestalotiopsis fici W106-1]|uniref:Uncharacterized protein n=1 Tax=Pestalotiopsis fici (strain W106-1 / CGMCC3.15140) TaxID=1229662 RepID=W3X8K7_PESFW|nr:uncharacterized protein PFICI_04251 [Pestalotiopsis fici W106-1]ETS82375.1 hypothetical protein PFICI_04251 [Pestalotiopsis fici W106-1]